MKDSKNHRTEDQAAMLRHRLQNVTSRPCPPYLDLVVKFALIHRWHLGRRIHDKAERTRAYSAPIFWPCHRVIELQKAIVRPESSEIGVLIEFFRDVAGLEFLDRKKHMPAWFTPPPSVVLAALATIRGRARLRRSLRNFRLKLALSDAELWMGAFIFEASVVLRNEILSVLGAMSVAGMCEFCHRLILSKRKYCSDQCMHARKDAKRQRRTKPSAH
jgi:hypothetical protein